MLNRLSLRARLTLLSAVVMISVAVALTVMSIVSADLIFVQDFRQKLDSGSVSDSLVLTSRDSREGNYIVRQTDEPIAYFTPDGDAGNDGVPLAPVKYADYSVIQMSLTRAGRRFNMWGIGGLVLIIMLGSGATWLMAGRALEPVRDLSSTIQENSGSDLSRRVEIHGRQDEIGCLSASFNAMMDKVSASFERQKRFCASVAHELKTPLATIQVGLEVLDLDLEPDPERMKKALAVTKTNTDRMIRLMDDLFRLFTDDEYEMGEEVIIGDLFAEIVDELSLLLGRRRLTATVAAADVTVTGNRALLYRALFNLIENAAKYNQEGGFIVLEAVRDDKEAAVRITDSGPGIPANELAHIFEPFYRIDRSRSRTMGGSGLGLSLALDIVEKHGGSIGVESMPGKGTSFTVHLPCSIQGQHG